MHPCRVSPLGNSSRCSSWYAQFPLISLPSLHMCGPVANHYSSFVSPANAQHSNRITALYLLISSAWSWVPASPLLISSWWISHYAVVKFPFSAIRPLHCVPPLSSPPFPCKTIPGKQLGLPSINGRLSKAILSIPAIASWERSIGGDRCGSPILPLMSSSAGIGIRLSSFRGGLLALKCLS